MLIQDYHCNCQLLLYFSKDVLHQMFSSKPLSQITKNPALQPFQQQLTLYVVYFTVPHHLFYQQKMSRLLCLSFGLNSGLECTRYYLSSSPLPYLPSAMASQCFYRPLQVSCCLLVVRVRLLYFPLKRLHGLCLGLEFNPG